MEDSKTFLVLLPDGVEILKRSRSVFCHVLKEKFGCTAEIRNVEYDAASSFSHSKATIVPEFMYTKRLFKSMNVSVWKDDLTTHKADAVVNAANEHLSHGGGLALALCRAGGPKIQEWSDDIIKSFGRIETGEAVITPAGNLPCEIIIHAVGPSVSKNATQGELNTASYLLGKTIWSILQKADYDNVQSVAIPAISSGLFNFPLQLCAEMIVRTVWSFSNQRNPGAKNLEVRLVNNDDPSVQQMLQACLAILGPSDPIPVQGPSNASDQSVFSSLDLGNVTLHLKKGAIEQETADVIVNTVGTDLNLSGGLVSKAILQKAGSKIQDEIKKKHRGLVSPGNVFSTAGYKLKCKEVYHTVCAQRTNTNADQILSSVIIHCLNLAIQHGHSSIKFPAIGTGHLGFEKEDVSNIMTRAVVDFSRGHRGKKLNICFVIFPKDTKTLKAFEKRMTSQNTFHTSNTSSSTRGESFADGHWPDPETTPCVTLFGSSAEALKEAKLWCVQVLQIHSGEVTINNNHVVYFTQKDHASLMKLQARFNVMITEFFKKGKGGIIIHGDPVGLGCAALEVEAMLCQAQEEFAKSEERGMQDDLELMYEADDFGQQQIERMSFKKISIDLRVNNPFVNERVRNFKRYGLRIVKMEEIENIALKQLFELRSKRVLGKPQHLYQCVKAQFCDLICRVGFQREYAPPEEPKYGAGIYFTTEVSQAKSLWADNGEEYVYVIEALVLTGQETTGTPDLIVPPPTGKDPLVRYDSVTNKKDIYVIFNGQQAYPKLLITCHKEAA